MKKVFVLKFPLRNPKSDLVQEVGNVIGEPLRFE